MKNETYEQLFKMSLEGDGKVLKGYSNFHNYSFGNQMLAMFQMLGRGIEVSPIATYKKWSSLGRQVRKGEKAIELLMPVSKKDEDTGKMKTFFITKRNWFAMSQTEGEEIKLELPKFNFDNVLQVLGIEKVKFDIVAGNVQGFARAGKQIAINPIAEMPQKTFFHEVAHVILGHIEGKSDLVDSVATEKNIKEVEAESVAMCCMLALGIDGLEYPRGYIKGWLGKNEISADSIKRIFRATNEILKAGQEKPIDKD